MEKTIGILVDVDGLLIDTREHMFNTYAEIIEHFGLEPVTRENFSKILSPDHIELAKRLGLDSIEKMKYGEQIYNKNIQNNKHGICVYEGANEFLEKLRNIASIVLTTASGRKQLKMYEEIIGLRRDMKTVTKDDVRNIKPHKDHLITAMECAGSVSSNTIMIDDMPDNLETAKLLGIYVIGVTWGFSSKESFQHLEIPVASSFEELWEEVLKFQKSI